MQFGLVQCVQVDCGKVFTVCVWENPRPKGGALASGGLRHDETVGAQQWGFGSACVGLVGTGVAGAGGSVHSGGLGKGWFVRGEFSGWQASYFVACLAHGLHYIFDCILSPYALIPELGS